MGPNAAAWASVQQASWQLAPCRALQLFQHWKHVTQPSVSAHLVTSSQHDSAAHSLHAGAASISTMVQPLAAVPPVESELQPLVVGAVARTHERARAS
jgi:hypothetical protein